MFLNLVLRVTLVFLFQSSQAPSRRDFLASARDLNESNPGPIMPVFKMFFFNNPYRSRSTTPKRPFILKRPFMNGSK